MVLAFRDLPCGATYRTKNGSVMYVKLIKYFSKTGHINCISENGFRFNHLDHYEVIRIT